MLFWVLTDLVLGTLYPFPPTVSNSNYFLGLDFGTPPYGLVLAVKV